MDLAEAQGLLSHLSSEEHKELLNDEDKFEALFKDMKQIKDWETAKEMLIASNRSLAEFNLAKEPELSEAKQELADKSGAGEELCRSIREKLQIYKSKTSSVSSDTTLALLETAAAESEESSEKIAQEFLDGKLDLDKFLEEFSKERVVMHLRKVKADKMSELLRTDSGARPPLFPYPDCGPQGYPRYGGDAMPYPVRPPAMPMPGYDRF